MIKNLRLTDDGMGIYGSDLRGNRLATLTQHGKRHKVDQLFLAAPDLVEAILFMMDNPETVAGIERGQKALQKAGVTL